MTVVPGCSAVMILVVALMLATEEVPTEKLSVPMDEPQVGFEVAVVALPESAVAAVLGVLAATETACCSGRSRAR